ncbi:MAG: glycosyltransferase, partial [Desulfovibrio fairfieldensis]|nr:glycosyltransferase [Desulfovibrio fairfieldensis]
MNGAKMTNRLPLISVIIPTYNYGRFLPDAVKSVLGQKKDGLAVEIIVVDDGSTDDTADVAQRLGSSIQYIYQENQGLSAARNAGIRAAHGDYLVFLDADDLLTSGTLASHLNNFAVHPELDVSVCLSLQTFSSDSERRNYLWPLKCAHLDMHLCHSNISPVHTFMLRAEAAQEIGFFDPDLKACEDQDYWLRCAALGKRFGANPEGLVIYRQHGQSMTSQMSRQLAHDGAIRFKISRLLETRPDFPRAGKFYGWLAHAAGTIG